MAATNWKIESSAIRKRDKDEDLDQTGKMSASISQYSLNGFENGRGEERDPQLSEDHSTCKYERKYVPGKGIERYSNSLKTVIPFRRAGSERGTVGIDSAGLFSTLTMSWISKVMYKAYSKGITMEELPPLSSCDNSNYNADRLELLWNEELAMRKPDKASFSRVAWKFCRTRILVSCVILIGSFVCSFLSFTFLMRKLLEYVQSDDKSYGTGFKWALLLIAAVSGRTFLLNWSWMMNYRTALKLRTACLMVIYKKINRVNNLGNKNFGEVINVFSNDAQRIFDMVSIGPLMIEAPIATIYAIWYVVWHFGPMALLGMLVFILYFPIQYTLSRLIGHFQTRSVKITDMRIRLMNDILDHIKLIKMYAWEKYFSDDLVGVRNKEQKLLLKTTYCQSFSFTSAPTVSVISLVVTFLAHASAGNNLVAAQVFPYSSFLESRLRVSLILFRDGLTNIMFGRVSLNRIQRILLTEDEKCYISKPILKSQSVAISNGTFAYKSFSAHNRETSKANDKKRKNEYPRFEEKSEQEKLNKPADNAEHVDILFDISFEATKGKLVGICGHVGSGKSSLLLAALGQLKISEGQVTRDGSCAYVSQQAWITNATLKENILFGEKYDHSRYHEAIHACSLSQDIDMMPGGDKTEIGEKGVNLSGGQKQRVALARALYANRDIYFLDDPLSAVDSRVGSHIFDNLILKALKEKTVLFVTHQIQYLNRCDDIYMMRDGRIVEHGTHDELMKLGDEYASMVAALSTDNDIQDESSVNQRIEAFSEIVENNIRLDKGIQSRSASPVFPTRAESVKESNAPNTKLTVDENLQQGTIKAHTFHAYIMAAGGYFFSFLVLFIYLTANASTALSSWLLAVWIEAGGGNTTVVKNNVTMLSDNIHDNPDIWYYEAMYGGTIGLVVATNALCSMISTKVTIGASTKMHNGLFKKIIQCPMRFFDTTPTGRIQTVFSRDMDEVDKMLPDTLVSFLYAALKVILTVLVISLVFPWFALLFLVLFTLYYFVSKIFRAAVRDLRRMENKSRAPVISFVTATLQGLPTIHAFGKGDDFTEKFDDLLNENSKYVFMFNAAVRWLALRIDVLAVATIAITAFLIIIFRDQVPPSFGGLALSYANQISGYLPFLLRVLSEAEFRFISVERINNYIRTLESEGSSKQHIVKQLSNWPVLAAIEFKNVSLAYGDGAPLILKNLSFSIHAREKIGIVGRTGAGKSSLTVALFRLVELTEGKIEIDDIDISEISLDQLRTKLSIIPQDPVLFIGTIRSNLDPFKLYTDSEIWKALEKTELKSKVQSITGQLDASVGFGGDNLSLGERQLLCLTRALLRNSKVLILDEATAAVDPETEVAVQNTVQREFANCTILTIAHRLQTVLPLDRVLVMDGGKVLEFDTPSNLLRNPSSEFFKMMAAAEQAESQ